jgi:hypothetical protein
MSAIPALNWSVTRSRSLWKINTKRLGDSAVRCLYQQVWTRRRLQKGKHPFCVTWLEKLIQRKIRFLFIQEGAARTREEMINENFYYACIYDILKDRMEKTPTLKHLIAKIARLHSKRLQSITMDTQEATFFQVESSSLFSSPLNAETVCVAGGYRYYRQGHCNTDDH